MPCSVSDSEKNYYLEKHIDKLTDMLCKQCEWSCLDISLNAPIHVDVDKWWEEHKIDDKNESIGYKLQQVRDLVAEIDQLKGQTK